MPFQFHRPNSGNAVNRRKDNTMKKTLTLILGVLAAGTMFSLAQDEGEKKTEGEGQRGGGGPRGGGRGIPQAMLEKYDANKDGKLDDEERKAAREGMQADRAAAEKAADTNGDGTLDEAERTAMRVKMLTPRYDENKDGKLDAEETKKMEEAMARFRGRGQGDRPEGGRPPRGERPEGGRPPRGERPEGGDKAPEGGDKAPKDDAK
jgi:hypothetical protein